MKGCLIGLTVFVALVVGGALLVWSQRDNILAGIENALDLPEYGTEQYIKPRYGDHLMSIRSAADHSESLFQFGAAVETMGLPPEFLYVGIEQDDDKTDIIKRFDWSSHSLVSSGDYGAGTLDRDRDNRRIMTWSQEGNWPYMDSFSVYIEYTGEADDGDPPLQDASRTDAVDDMQPGMQ